MSGGGWDDLLRYEILAEISRGGMGIVYRARDTGLNREVALKVLPPELVADPDRKRRFVQEAQAAAGLTHPHIATIYEIGESAGISFIAMELIEGRKLADMLDGTPLPVHLALELATEIAEGLARAHAGNVVHRDIKPANIMVTADGHAKVIDFGLAKLVPAVSGDPDGLTTADHTSPGTVLGTTAYMSPEQARGITLDHRTDIFSLGVVLFEMVDGRLRFARRRQSIPFTRSSTRPHRHWRARLPHPLSFRKCSASCTAVSRRTRTTAIRRRAN